MPRDSLVTLEYVNRHGGGFHACVCARTRMQRQPFSHREGSHARAKCGQPIVTKRGPQARDDMLAGSVGGTKTVVTRPRRPRVSERVTRARKAAARGLHRAGASDCCRSRRLEWRKTGATPLCRSLVIRALSPLCILHRDIVRAVGRI